MNIYDLEDAGSNKGAVESSDFGDALKAALKEDLAAEKKDKAVIKEDESSPTAGMSFFEKMAHYSGKDAVTEATKNATKK